MYRTAQWIKSQIHTRKGGETEVITLSESRENLVEATGEGKMNPNEGGAKKSGGGRESTQVLRTTMQKYWVSSFLQKSPGAKCALNTSAQGL